MDERKLTDQAIEIVGTQRNNELDSAAEAAEVAEAAEEPPPAGNDAAGAGVMERSDRGGNKGMVFWSPRNIILLTDVYVHGTTQTTKVDITLPTRRALRVY